MDYILVAVFSYIIGSIPSGLILGRLFWHTDLRAHGSRNIGATNAWRTLGKGAGIAVFIADCIKGQAGVLLGLSLPGTPIAAVIGGLFAIIGHSFSLFLRFHGGKGVAISRRFDNIDGECYLPCICNLADHCLQDAVCFSRLSYGRCSHTNPCCGLWVPDGVYPLCHACFYSCYSAAS